MKEKVILIIIIVAMFLLVGGATFVLKLYNLKDYTQENMEDLSNDNLHESGDEYAKSGDDKDLLSGESLKEVTISHVSNDTFESEVLKSDKIVIVDFYADWCGPCKLLAPILQEFANENLDIKVVKLNIDENEDTANAYRIYSIPTMVIIKDGEELDRMIGVNSKENIKKTVDLIK